MNGSRSIGGPLRGVIAAEVEDSLVSHSPYAGPGSVAAFLNKTGEGLLPLLVVAVGENEDGGMAGTAGIGIGGR